MKIIKGITDNWNAYIVSQRTQTWWQRVLRLYTETELTGVLEADDADGRVVLQVHENGFAVFTNNRGEEIQIDNTAKILMLDAMMRANFLRAGFVPKVTVTFLKNIRITNRNPIAAIEAVEEKLDLMKRRSDDTRSDEARSEAVEYDRQRTQ